MGAVVAVQRDNLRNTDLQEGVAGSGDLLLQVNHFALTANNVTYAAFGDRMNYWDFFPIAKPWGLVPVWGFAEVVQSTVDGVSEAERFYGYFPMAEFVRMSPVAVSPAGFTDGVESRASLTPGYNRYARTSADPLYGTASEEMQMLLRPLFLTAYAIDDYLADNAQFGARRVLLSSASSKTAYAAAFLIRQRGSIEVVGLTSPQNRSFVQGLGCYDRVLTYDEVQVLPEGEPTVFVDMAANGQLRAAIHSHFAERLKLSCAVGATNWDKMLAGQAELPGPRPERFFVPTQMQKRIREWGAEGLQRDFRTAWNTFIARAAAAPSPWITVTRQRGTANVAKVWLDLVEGKVDPREGHILSLV